MADIVRVVDSRFKDLEASASELQKLLSDQRYKEEHPSQGLMFSAGADPRTPEEREADRQRKQKWREAEERKRAAKYQPLENAIATHLQGLAAFKSDIEGLIQKENKRAFWNGFWMNALFFVLGLAASAIPASQLLAFIGAK